MCCLPFYFLCGTFSHFAGRTICRLINRKAIEITCKTVPTPDPIDNLTNLQGGSLDIGLVDSRLLHDAVNKTGAFAFLDIRYDNLRAIAPIYAVPITLVARKDADINSLEALKGKRVNLGAPGSPTHFAVTTIMKMKNWFRIIRHFQRSASPAKRIHLIQRR